MSARLPQADRMIWQEFVAEEVGSEFMDGQLRWGVKCGLTIHQSGLTQAQASELARLLNMASNYAAERWGYRVSDRQLIFERIVRRTE